MNGGVNHRTVDLSLSFLGISWLASSSFHRSVLCAGHLEDIWSRFQVFEEQVGGNHDASDAKGHNSISASR